MEWFAEHGVELAGWLLTVVVTVVGWVMEHRSSRSRDAERREDIGMLERQVAVLQAQAASVEEQTAMQRAAFDRPPFGEAEWLQGSLRRIEVTGSRRVYVESIVCADPGVMFIPRTVLPDSFDPSETIEYIVNGPFPVTVSWRWDDEPDMPLRTVRRVSYKPGR